MEEPCATPLSLSPTSSDPDGRATAGYAALLLALGARGLEQAQQVVLDALADRFVFGG